MCLDRLVAVGDIAIDLHHFKGCNADLLAVEFGPDAAGELVALPVVRENMLGARSGTRAARELHGETGQNESLHYSARGFFVLCGHLVGERNALCESVKG